VKLGAMIYSFGPAIRSGQATQRDVIEFCAGLGLPCVDTMDGLGDEPWPEVRRMVEDAGMFIASHITAANLAAADAPTRQQAMDKVRAAAADAAVLGTPTLMIVTGRIPEGDTRQATIRRLGDALQILSEEARTMGVRLCIEDFPGETSPHRTSAELLAVCDRAGPDLGICFDTANFYTGGETPEEAWPRLADKVVHAHLKDWRWDDQGPLSTPDGRRFSPELVGRGFINYPAVLAQMKASRYEKALSFEYEGAMDRFEAARQGIAYLQAVLAALEKTP